MATSISRLFALPGHAAIYAKYRFVTPPKVIHRIMEYVKNEIKTPLTLAVDIGCGSGQSTKCLAAHFENVLGIDVSSAQIQEAQNSNTHTNITYKVGDALNIPANDHSVQLVSGSQCHHWLELSKFYEDAKRVLMPKGVLCLYWYTMPQPLYNGKTKQLQDLLHHLYTVETKEFWDERRKMVDKGFNDLPFPFENVVKENMSHNIDITLEELIGYVKSWSAYQQMKKTLPLQADQMMQTFEDQLKSIVGEDKDIREIPLKLEFTYYVIIGRTPGPK